MSEPPKHLQEYIVDETLQGKIETLSTWLEGNGVFEPGIPHFDKCTSKELGENVGELWKKAVELFSTIRSNSTTPQYWGVARPYPGGAWMTNDHAQLLIPIRALSRSSPYIGMTSEVAKSTSFTPGKAFYFAPGQIAFISEGVEFFFIH